MTIYIIITASLINGDPAQKRDYNTRKAEYKSGLEKISNFCKDKPYKLVIVENTHMLFARSRIFNVYRTFLEDYGIPVVYTLNNKFKTRNYGAKELMDIQHVIQQVGIQDDDFIVKITGRYLLDNDCPFFDVVNNLDNVPYSAIIRFGSYRNYDKIRAKDNCVTGLIGLKCKYVKELAIPPEDKYVEEVWAEKIASLPENEVCILEKLGIFIRPANLERYTLI